MERLARLARPTYSGGRWHKARVSAKNLARYRKQALLAGDEWTLERPRKPLHINPLAGRKRIMQRPERQAEIQARLDRMPEIIEEYRQYLIQSKTDAYDKRELHVYFDADQIAGDDAGGNKALSAKQKGGSDTPPYDTFDWGPPAGPKA